jgi:hypothetical protein
MTTKRIGSVIGAGQEAYGAYLAAIKAFRGRRSLLLIAARGLLAARLQYPNHRSFGRWLRQSAYSGIDRHNRAALLNIARHEAQLAPFLQTTTLASPILIWRTARRMLADKDA